MANKSISMVQIRRIVQLKADGKSKREISKILGIHRTTLDSYLTHFEATGLSYSELCLVDDEKLKAIAYPPTLVNNPDTRLEQLKEMFPVFKRELSKPGVTRLTLWEEYLKDFPEGYGYTQFCEHFSRYLLTAKATMYFTHNAGEYLQIDFAGKHLHYVDVTSGELIACPVLVCTLPYSGFTYVEALLTAKQEHLFEAMNRCLEYLGGVPRNVLSDNMKQFISKNERYEFTFPQLAEQWSAHYNTNLDATRPRKPKDKSTVENHVYLSYLRIYAKLRNEEFHSLPQLNKRVHELLEAHNTAAFQKLPGNRRDKFIAEERTQLKELPQEPFTIKHTTVGKVQMNYHVILGEDKHQYSVPYQHIGQTTKIIYDTQNVEIYIGFNRIALHKRNYRPNGYTTLDEHMPEKHLRYIQTKGWDADYFLSLASKIGEHSTHVFQTILDSKAFIEQTYKTCIGLKRLSEIYGSERFEAACKRTMNSSRVTYGMIKNILEKNLDKEPETQLVLFTLPQHENLRGPLHYN